jgi:polyhydroxyalkanoate synthesis repressor PhaR
MTLPNQPVIIKKYANRRLYNTETSTYVTLDDLAEMVKEGRDFLVQDAKTGENITRSVLTQIIFEQENRSATSLLPITFLRQLIRFYGDSLQNIVPSYLEHSLGAFTQDQDKLREQMSKAFGASPFDVVQEQVRNNMKMFEQAYRMFSPFPGPEKNQPSETPPSAAAGTSKEDLEVLKRQINEMHHRLNELSAETPK